MRIVTFRIDNYKSFSTSGEIRFEPGFNVIVGQNNVGKTALTEALSLAFSANPHRSRTTITTTASPNPRSRAVLSFKLGFEELKTILAYAMTAPFYVPRPPTSSEAQVARQFLEIVSEGPTVEAVYENEAAGHGVDLANARLLGYEVDTEHDRYLKFNVNPTTGEPEHEPGEHSGPSAARSEFSRMLADVLRSRIYGFKAVRFGISDTRIGAISDLAPDAGNLVQVLNLLYNTNPSRWEKYIASVRTILPQIKAITFAPSEQDTVRALLWNIDLDTERDDLAVPLSKSGTGVGQVLAILYVAFASEYPRTIVIDEPKASSTPALLESFSTYLGVTRSTST